MKSLIANCVADYSKSSKLWRPGFSFTYSFRVLLLYCRYMDLKKVILLKKINYSQPLKLKHNIKIHGSSPPPPIILGGT